MSTLYEETAGKYRRKAGYYDRASMRAARVAVVSYEAARSYGRQARWLADHPDLWITGGEGANPARSEQIAVALAREGDAHLARVFATAKLAETYRGMARGYDVLAARRMSW